MRIVVSNLPVIAAAGGALLWWLARPPKLTEAGRLLFFAGTLALLIAGAR